MNVIVAADENWAIGKGGDQLCYIPADLKRFQALTTGHPVLVGRKTLATFPNGRPLKNRRNLILSRDPEFALLGGEVYPALEAALAHAPEDTFVIGGEEIYRQTQPLWTKAYVTKIHKAFPADRWFPDLDTDPTWEVVEEEGPFPFEDFTYSYVTYQKKL